MLHRIAFAARSGRQVLANSVVGGVDWLGDGDGKM